MLDAHGSIRIDGHLDGIAGREKVGLRLDMSGRCLLSRGGLGGLTPHRTEGAGARRGGGRGFLNGRTLLLAGRGRLGRWGGLRLFAGGSTASTLVTTTLGVLVGQLVATKALFINEDLITNGTGKNLTPGA